MREYLTIEMIKNTFHGESHKRIFDIVRGLWDGRVSLMDLDEHDPHEAHVAVQAFMYLGPISLKHIIDGEV